MLYCYYFTDMQDRATLGSDSSGISDSEGAVSNALLFFNATSETQSVKPRGWGRAPVLLFVFQFIYWKWIHTRL